MIADSLKKRLGIFDHWQINHESGSSNEAEIENNKVKSFASGDTERYIIKAWKGKRYGVVSASKIDFSIIDRLDNIIKNGSDLEYFYGLPSNQRYRKVDVFDKKVEGLDAGDLVDYAKGCINDVKTKEISVNGGAIIASTGANEVMNSNDVYAKEKRSGFFAVLSSVAKDSFSEMRNESYYFDNKELCSRLREKTKDFMKVKKLEKKKPVVVFSNEVFASLMRAAFLENFNAKNAENGRSIFSGRLGKKIAGDVSLTDDALLDLGENSSSFDDEGSATGKTPLIENGIMKSLVYDFNTARRAGKRNTANASGSGLDFSNLIFKAKEINIDDAIIIENIIGAHTANPMTTEFSVNVQEAYLIENGRKMPVRGFMISGKMTEAMNSIIGMSKDMKHSRAIYSGDVACRGVNIIL